MCLRGRRDAHRRATPVFLPRNVLRGFRVVSDGPLRILTTVTPADPDVAAVAAAAEAYDLEILGPLPG